MAVFVQRPFWALPYRQSSQPHFVSTVVTPPAFEPITVAQGKKFARDETVDDSLMRVLISAARSKVEQDTGLALVTQTRDVTADHLNDAVIQLPPQSMPLQSVTSVKSTDTSGTVNTMATSDYIVDLASGRIGLADSGYWASDLRSFHPWVIRIVSGWTAPELIPPDLVLAVGLLAAHYANAGRDIALVGAGLAAIEMPFGYEAAIAPHRLIYVA